MTVTDVNIFNDQNNIESTRSLRLSFMTNRDSLGGVFVHQHHSTRTIQIQGTSTTLGLKFVLWFANFLIGRFTELAKTKQYQIRKTNNFFKREMQSNQVDANSNSCQYCGNIFNVQSKPSMCKLCFLFCHTSCIKNHHKTYKGSAASCDPNMIHPRNSSSTPLSSTLTDSTANQMSTPSSSIYYPITVTTIHYPITVTTTSSVDQVLAADKPPPVQTPSSRTSITFVPTTSSSTQKFKK